MDELKQLQFIVFVGFFLSIFVWASTASATESKLLGLGNKTEIRTDSSKALTPPGDLRTAAVSSRQVIIQWNDNSVGEDGFIVERRRGKDKSFQNIGSAPMNSTSFVDNYIQSTGKYEYRIRAYKKNGVYSSYSNTLKTD